MDDHTEGMKKSWEKRAQSNPLHYIETTFDAPDIESFFENGEKRAIETIDPLLNQWDAYSEGTGKTALDIGCGVGRLTRSLSDRFDRVIGIDVSQSMISMAKELHSGFDNVEFHTTDGQGYAPIDDGEIDFVFSYEVFQHLPNKDVIRQNFSEIYRVLTSGGLAHVYVNVPRGWATAFGLVPVPRKVKTYLPSWLIESYHQLQANGELKTDETWRGVNLTRSDWHYFLEEEGFENIRTTPDSTHQTPVSEFVTAQKPKSKP